MSSSSLREKISLSLSRATGPVKSKKAFTLVELMIVIAIIGVLAASLFPMMSGYMAKARDTARIQDISQIGASLQLYSADHGYMKKTTTYGGADPGGADYSSQPIGNPTFLKFLTEEGYIRKIPADPINNAACMMGSGQPDCPGFSYVYYCYDAGGAILYDQYLLGARMERPSGSGTNLTNGKIGGMDGAMYYFGRINEGSGQIIKSNATACQ